MRVRDSQSVRDFWSLARINFEKNDGALPGVGIAGLSVDELASVFRTLREMGRLVTANGVPPTYWDIAAQAPKSMDAVPNAAVLVAAGDAECFHALIDDVRFGGVPVPQLGVAVYTDSIFLDYRMGPEWTIDVVLTFFRILKCLHDIAPHSHLEFDSEVLDPEAFDSAWMFFLKQKLDHPI